MIIDSLLLQLGSMLLLASVVGLLCHYFKQPLFFAYIFTGIIVGILGSNFTHNTESLHFFSELGIAFLLFLVGLELNIKNIVRLGKAGVITALAQVVIVGIISFSIATWFGMNVLPAVYIALAMTIASAVISVKYLTERNALDTLYGKIDLVLHLVQDIVAVIAIIILSGINDHAGAGGATEVLLVVARGIALICVHLFLSHHILPRIFRLIANSSELLLLASISWCVLGAATAQMLGFSVEIGAFLAGLGLSSSSYQFQIAAKIKPLRDFFIVVFFISLGMQISVSSPIQIIIPAIALSAIVVVVNPLVTAILLGRFGYKRHTAFYASMLMSQIGEFSLVLAAMGVANQHLSNQQGSLITLIVLITMLSSSILLKYENALYKKVKPLLVIIERPDVHERRVKRAKRFSNHIVILGANRLGSDVIDTLQHSDRQVVVVDVDPERVATLTQQGHTAIYGDAADETVLHEASVNKALLVISTVPQQDATMQVMRLLKEYKSPAHLIVTANSVNDALMYYRLGASYVIIPKLIGSSAMTHIVKNHLTDLDNLETAKVLHLQHLSAVSQLGK